MQALILNGSHPNDPTAARAQVLAQQKLQARGYAVEVIRVCEQKIGNCAGDFFCWMRNPGLCNTDDDNRAIAEKFITSDLAVMLTPIAFGGYASPLKRAVDHFLPNILPFFTQIKGETHHQPRYQKYPNLFVLGWLDAPDAQLEATFRHLVYRNMLNMYTPAGYCGLVTGSQPEGTLETELETGLEAIARGTKPQQPVLPTIDIVPAESTTPLQKVILLVGSPRTRKSTSASLGGYLLEQLAAKGADVETIHTYTSFNAAERASAALAAIDAADLVILAFPLYVDGLPGALVAALEKIVAHRAGKRTQPRFVAIANCGFPEAQHNATALAICANFARAAGFVWAGNLSMGAGEMIHGARLTEMGGPAIPVMKALDVAAAALIAQQSISVEARNQFARPVIPHFVYTFLGNFGWKEQAKRWGAEKLLKRQPYAVK
jgi:multimeric flavodoxin WrbA